MTTKVIGWAAYETVAFGPDPNPKEFPVSNPNVNTDSGEAPPTEVSFEDFKKVDLRLGTVKTAERVPDTDKLIKMQVSFGSFERQIVAGIGKVFDPSVLIGRQYTFVVNLAPRKLRGVESHGMMLAASANDTLLLVGTTDLGPLLPDGTVIG